MPIDYHVGYVPTLLGRVVEMHAAFYSREYGFGRVFECKVASEMAEFLGRADQSTNAIYSATVQGRVIGSVSIDGQDLGGGVAHLRWFILDDAARGQGVGRALMQRAMDHVDAQGFAETRLWTFRGLDAARHLYESFGFELAEEQPGQQWGTEVSEQRFDRRLGHVPLPPVDQGGAAG